jgi:hypothetical protein
MPSVDVLHCGNRFLDFSDDIMKKPADKSLRSMEQVTVFPKFASRLGHILEMLARKVLVFTST